MKETFFILISTLIVLSSSQSCKLIVPTNPLTSEGLSTPFILKSGCNQANKEESVFAEAVIINQKTGKLSIYPPLIINEGTLPLIPPMKINLTNDEIVGIWFGSNKNLEMVDNGKGSLNQGSCISGVGNDSFGQVAACNAIQFFEIANGLVRNGILRIPRLGFGKNGKPCYTTRSFQVVDQDQSDNVDTIYLSVGNKTAQFSVKNELLLSGKNPQIVSNPSDNGLLNKFILPALGCRSFTAEDLVNVGVFRGAQALNELQASVFQRNPIALVPSGNPMVLANGKPNLLKLNQYRKMVNQPVVFRLTDAATSDYCNKLLTVGFVSIIGDQRFTMAFASPNPEVADNLYSFLVLRFFTAFGADGLDCPNVLQLNKRIRTRNLRFSMLSETQTSGATSIPKIGVYFILVVFLFIQ
jgi:hypothetical protein